MVTNKKGFLALRTFVAIWLGIGGLVALVVLHPLVAAMVATFMAGTDNALQIFAVGMIELFFVLMLFVSVIITATTGE